MQPLRLCLSHAGLHGDIRTSAASLLPPTHPWVVPAQQKPWKPQEFPPELLSQNYTHLANLNAESLARAWPPLREAQKPQEALADPKIQGSPGLPAFPLLLQNNHRCDSNSHPTASAKNRVTESQNRDQPWDQISPDEWNYFIPSLSGEWWRGETFRNFSLAENFTPNCRSEFHTDVTCSFCWSIDLPTAQGCLVSASSLCSRHLWKAPGSAQVPAHSLQPTPVLLIAFGKAIGRSSSCNHVYCSILAFLVSVKKGNSFICSQGLFITFICLLSRCRLHCPRIQTWLHTMTRAAFSNHW